MNDLIDFGNSQHHLHNTSPLLHHTDDSHDNHGHPHGIHLFMLNWEYVEFPLMLTAVICILGIFKVAFHHTGILARVIPESCLLIIIGLLVGTLVYLTNYKLNLEFTPSTFFLYLLPPIMLEAAFSLHDRSVYENLGTILLYAVVGTIMNCFTIGIVIFGFSKLGLFAPEVYQDLTMTRSLLFSALISAVDPVAVLAIFAEIGVNPVLYFLVFGESLLNDAVTVVLYRTMAAFTEMEAITALEIFKGFLSFFIVSLGGVLIGLIFGVITALLTRLTTSVRVMEPLAILFLAYASYLTAEVFEFSGIIGIITCGVIQVNNTLKLAQVKMPVTDAGIA